jgi:hypothetical protein
MIVGASAGDSYGGTGRRARPASPGAGHVQADRLEAARHDEAARAVQARTGGRWACWYGHSTGSYWAFPKLGPDRLIEGRTHLDLIAAMGEVDAPQGGALRLEPYSSTEDPWKNEL